MHCNCGEGENKSELLEGYNDCEGQMKSPLQIPAKTRQKVYDRDGGCCVMCGRPTTEQHHIIGGKMGCRRVHVEENLLLLCYLCHDRTHRGKQSEKLQRWCEQWSRDRYGDVIDRIKKGEKL